MTPTAQIEVIGGRQAIELTAIVDTGFDGDLCIPTCVAVQLGRELTSELEVELADGTRRNQLVFAGSVRFLGEAHEVRIMLTDSEDALIGTDLLELHRVSLDFPGAQVKQRTRRQAGEKR